MAPPRETGTVFHRGRATRQLSDRRSSQIPTRQSGLSVERTPMFRRLPQADAARDYAPVFCRCTIGGAGKVDQHARACGTEQAYIIYSNISRSTGRRSTYVIAKATVLTGRQLTPSLSIP